MSCVFPKSDKIGRIEKLSRWLIWHILFDWDISVKRQQQNIKISKIAQNLSNYFTRLTGLIWDIPFDWDVSVKH